MIDRDVIAALAYCRKGGPRPKRDSSFHEAKKLGLLAQDPVWRTTEEGDGVLIAVGVLEGKPAPERVTIHVLWARLADGEPSAPWPQFVAAFSDGLVDCMYEAYEAQREEAEQRFREVADVAEFFTTVEQVVRPAFPGPR
jgi:hypothetical protein